MTVSVEAGPPCIQSPCILIEVDIYSEKFPLSKPSIEKYKGRRLEYIFI